MRTLKFALVLFLTAVLLPYKTFAQIPLSDKAEISLLTCGPGDELYSVFGHTGIRVSDPATGLDVVYNYGQFDFDTPNFYGKFIKGNLQYNVGLGSYEDFIYTYRYYNRDVYEQFLDLTHLQKQKIADELSTTLLSNKRFYTYKFIDRNCTTKAADVLNNHIPGKISMKNTDSGKTNRTVIYEKLHNKFYENLGIHLMFGYKTDKELYNLFLPQQLMEGIANTTINGKPLAKSTITVFKADRNDEKSIWNNYYTFCAVMLVLIVSVRNKIVQRSFLTVAGLLGIVFATVGFYSLHEELLLNYNALLCNPLFLALLYFIFTGNKKWVTRMANACLAILGIYSIIMLNKPHLLFVLPIIAVILAAMYHIVKSNRAAIN